MILENSDGMMKSWFGLVDYDTHFYKSTFEVGSPYDLSVHHEHRYLKFNNDEFNSYIGADLIKTDWEEDLPYYHIWFKGISCTLVSVNEETGIKSYKIDDITQHPLYVENIRTTEFNQIDQDYSRSHKNVRYYNFKTTNDVKLQFKEKESLELLTLALLKSDNPVCNVSFGKDSLVVLHLYLRVTDMLNIPRHKVNVYWTDTKNEFYEVRKLVKKLQKRWGFNLIIGQPKSSLKQMVTEYGGLDESIFERKGKREKGKRTPLSEVCCKTLKHTVYQSVNKDYNFDLNISGVRIQESTQRLQSGLRDGEMYYAKSEWKSIRVNPILNWSDVEVFQYIEKNNIELPPLYYKNLILNENLGLIEQQELKELGIKDNVIEDPILALELKDKGYKVFMPRVGCLLCPIPVKYGYLKWLRRFYPKVFSAMVSNLGYGVILWGMVSSEKKQELELYFGRRITIDDIIDNNMLQEILDYMPCLYDLY